MHHISPFSLVVFSAICLLYALLVLAILQFCKVAKLEPNPPTSSTVRVELTLSARAPADAPPGECEGTCITTTFVLQETGGPIAGLSITREDDTHIRSLTLLGKDAEDVTSFLTHCFNCQLASHADQLSNEPVSRTA